jgi:hypothetical protein
MQICSKLRTSQEEQIPANTQDPHRWDPYLIQCLPFLLSSSVMDVKYPCTPPFSRASSIEAYHTPDLAHIEQQHLTQRR